MSPPCTTFTATSRRSRRSCATFAPPASIEIVVGGDVLPGPMPRESLACLLDLDIPVQFIQGNGDREVIAPTGTLPEAYRETMRWNAEQLSAEDVQRLAGWPSTRSRAD